LAVLFASTFASKEKDKKEAQDPPKKTSATKTEKRGVEELVYDPQAVGGYAGGYGYGDAGYALGGQHSLSLLGYGSYGLTPTTRIKSIVITKEVTIPVPQPYPVPVEKTIPYPVKVPVPVPVVKHYPVPVPKPYPVPVEKKVPYPVEKIVPYPVKVPVNVPVPVPHAVPVSKPYPVPVHVPHPVPVPQPVIVKNPTAVFLKQHGGLPGGYDSFAVDYGYGEHGSFVGEGFEFAGGLDGVYAHGWFH
jgi:hypothetical protein